MSNATQNPYAAPSDDSGAGAIDTQLPISTYFYAAVLFFIGSFATGFAAFAALAIICVAWQPAAFLIWLALPLGFVGGVFSARGMYRRLADIHRRKVELQMAEAERLGEFYTW